MSDAKPPVTREDRLAARLRENLKRRKAQAREINGTGATHEETPDSLETGLSNPAT